MQRPAVRVWRPSINVLCVLSVLLLWVLLWIFQVLGFSRFYLKNKMAENKPE